MVKKTAIPAVINCGLFMKTAPVLVNGHAKLLLFYYSCFLHFSYKLFCRLKGRDLMFRNVNGNIFLDIASNFGGTFFCDKRSKAPDIDVFTLRKRVLDLFKHGLKSH